MGCSKSVAAGTEAGSEAGTAGSTGDPSADSRNWIAAVAVGDDVDPTCTVANRNGGGPPGEGIARHLGEVGGAESSCEKPG